MSIDLEKIESAKGYLYVNDKRCPEPICVDDYIAYKEIEKELGIDLITFHKALKNGIYYRTLDKNSPNYGKIFFDRFILWAWEKDTDGNYFASMQSWCQRFCLKDYKKTWALTEEELTNGR